ncbi:unnamed protein product [Hyaloperonospora brassicae]|uniref:PNPLA domain-containing protein n=1 Tax=Hyaloperonospora brassicae TaxID=162125 RepID=A0AAV0V2J1_HYABA|nr:unnamed protein product [Hyaloperonospora brassicae]
MTDIPKSMAVQRANNNNNNNSEWIDVIVGCTTGGVLCGVYLTEVRLPRASAAHGLAPGAYPFDASAIDRTRLRITY